MEYNIYQKFTKEDSKAIREYSKQETNIKAIFFTTIFVRFLYFTYLSLIGLVFFYLVNKRIILIPIICCIISYITLLFMIVKYTLDIPIFIFEYYLKKNKIVTISNTYFRKGDKKISFEKVKTSNIINPDYYFFFVEASPVILKKEFVPDKLKEIIEVTFVEKEENKEDIV